jgi:hypothetical protein
VTATSLRCVFGNVAAEYRNGNGAVASPLMAFRPPPKCMPPPPPPTCMPPPPPPPRVPPPPPPKCAACAVATGRISASADASNSLVLSRSECCAMCFDLRPKIPSNLNSGAWKTGPNLPHGLTSQRDDRDSPFSSLLSKMCLFAKQSATYKGRSLLSAPRPDPGGGVTSAAPCAGKPWLAAWVGWPE